MLVASIVPAAETAAVRQAREQVEFVRKLAEAGAASRKQVEQAAAGLQQAQDDALIAETLDARVAVEDLTEEQSTEATSAATRRLQRLQKRLAEQAVLVGQGVAPRTSLVPFEEEIESARRIVDAMEVRARSLAEIASMIRAPIVIEWLRIVSM